ncbi:MAG: DUF3570 domain-containing protein [Myxococcales bacterium]|nr:DUF3570 domain-containing protein [Myxococcales bacterium]
MAAVALLASTALMTPGLARADEVSGTWTGVVELRGNYFWEQSTRVIAPEGGVRLIAPNGVRLGVDYLVDSITSASQAAGVLEDVRFTEIRHQITLSGGYEFDLGDAQLDLNASYRISREPDYLSNSFGITAGLSLNDRSTVLRAALFYVHDEIRQVFRAGDGARPTTDGTTSADLFRESFDAIALNVAWEQLLSPVLFFQVAYQYGWMDGFLANAYRRVAVGDVLRPENHPGTRHRHSLTGRLVGHLRKTRTSAHIGYQAYLDSWDIAALSPEVRIYQEIASYAHLRLRYRYYRQTRSFFYSEDYATSTPEDAPVTADPKMSAFRVHTLGFQLVLEGVFLADTVLGFLRRASLDLSFEYRWNTNRFGNAVVSSVGVRVPF